MTAQQKESTPVIDYYRPIIADADTGHGGLTAVMKLTKVRLCFERTLFAVFGACLACSVLEPVSTHLDLLVVAR